MKKILFFTVLFASFFIANAQWVEQSTGFTTASRGIRNISIVDANTVWCAAYDGSGAGANIQEFTKTTDGGNTWTPGTIDVGNTSLGIAMIWATSATTAYAVAYTNSTSPSGQGIFVTTDGGATWARQTTADFQSASSFANVVYFWDTNNGFCMGDPIGSPAEFELYTTTDGGNTWTPVPGSDIPDPLSGEYGYTGQYTVNGDNIWFTTNKGRIYHSTDKGYTWNVYQSPISDFGSSSSSGDIAFVDATHGLLVNNAGTYWKTDDAGATWTQFTPNGNAYSTDIEAIPGTPSTYVSTGNTDGASFSLYGGSVWEDFSGNPAQMLETAWLDGSTGWVGGFNTDETTGGIYKFNGTIPTPFDNDLGILNIENPVSGGVLSTTENVSVEIMNYGLNPQSNFDVSYTFNGNTVTETVSATINPGETYIHTFASTEDLSAVGFYTISATTSLTGDEDNNNDEFIKDFYLLSFVPKKAVVYEEATGTWCGWCVRGIVGLKDMAHYHNDSTWIGIAVHNNDPMVVTEYDNAIGNFISGYPSGIMDRQPEEVDPGYSELEGAYFRRVDQIPLCKVEVTSQNWDAATREITLDLTTTFGIDASNINYNMAAIIVEDSVTGTDSGYDQTNYYSTSANSIDLTDWEGINYKFKPNPIPASEMVYNHVGRALLGGYNGVGGDIPTDVSVNTPYTHTFNYTLPSTLNENNIKLVGIVIDNNNGEIVNAIEVDLDVATKIASFEDKNIKLYPNPTKGQFIIENAENSNVEIFNTLGQKVLTFENITNYQVINLSGFEQGNYIVRLTNDKFVATKKINVVK